MGWIYVPLLGAFIGFVIGMVPFIRMVSRRKYARGYDDCMSLWRAAVERGPVDVMVECPCGATMNLSEADVAASETMLGVWWQWHTNHRITIEEYRARLAALHRMPELDQEVQTGTGLVVRRSAGWADTETIEQDEVVDHESPHY